MRTTTLALPILAFTLHLATAEYGDLTDCALPCSADVSGTNCTRSNWPCLCANGTWVDQLNACVVKSCNTTEQAASFLAFAQICAIFDVPLTASAEATFPASALSANASSSLSALDGPGPVSVTSMPTATPVASTMATSAAATSDTSSTTAGSVSSTTGTAAATATPSAGNVGVSSSERDVWFAMAVLLLVGAAIL